MAAHAKAWERDRECWEAGGKPVAWGYQEGGIDVCWLRPGRHSGWWSRWRAVTSVPIKLGPLCLQHQRLQTPRPPLALFSVCCMSLSEQRAVTPVTQQRRTLKYNIGSETQRSAKHSPLQCIKEYPSFLSFPFIFFSTERCSDFFMSSWSISGHCWWMVVTLFHWECSELHKALACHSAMLPSSGVSMFWHHVFLTTVVVPLCDSSTKIYWEHV